MDGYVYLITTECSLEKRRFNILSIDALFIVIDYHDYLVYAIVFHGKRPPVSVEEIDKNCS